MRKIGPTLAVVSGVFTIVMSILGILVTTGDITSTEFIAGATKQTRDNVNSDITIKTLYYISIGVASLMVIMGLFALSNSKGFAAFILLALFAASFGLGLWVGIEHNSFQTATIVTLSVTGAATLGLGIGFIAPK